MRPTATQQHSPGQSEFTSEEGGEAHHLDAGEVAEQLIQQGQPQAAGALHQLAHLLQAFEAAGFTEQLQEGPLRTADRQLWMATG